MKTNSIIFLLAHLLLFPITSQAQDGSFDMELENLSNQYAECAAYYSLCGDALISSDNPTLADKYLKSKEDLFIISFALAADQRTFEMAKKITIARFDIFKKEMLEMINFRYENIALLLNEYGAKCKSCLETPPKRVVECINTFKAKTDGH